MNRNEKRNKTILKNTVIFSIGNLGSKVLAYVMMLVYTHFISTSDLGYYDLIMTTVSLVAPLATMAFDEGEYRWLISARVEDRTRIISTCIKTVIATTLCLIAALFLLNVGFHFRYVVLIALYLGGSLIYSLVLNATRGLSHNKLYAASGILNSCILLVMELVGLVALHMGIEALLIANVISNTLTILFLYFKQQEFWGIGRQKYDRKLARQIFNYSMPLVPNQISWWIVNSSDRYIILFFLGTSFNGIYAISNKFPTVVTVITTIVYMALQETIIKEYNASDRNAFYSKTFKNYYVFLFSLIMCGIPATKLVINWFVSAAYNDAYKYMPFLYMSTVFSALSSLLGIGYQISKETKRSVLSTITAAGVNVAVNVLLIRFIGLHAASFSTLVAYVVLFIVRIYHSKRYFTLKINWALFIGMFALSILVAGVSYISNDVINIILTVVTAFIIFYCNKGIINLILKKKAMA
ncbi:MAG: lipopolysaccharide biosynthesis protein [Eubacterium sp.]